jgi:HEAT repeat protein
MTKLRHSAVFILLAIVAALVGLRLAQRPPEPAYQGRSLTVWLIRHADHSVVEIVDDEARIQAENAIRQIGTDALGPLLRMAMVHDSPLKAKALALFPDELRLRLGFRDEYDYSELARDGFHILGPIAKPLVPILIDLLNDKNPDVCLTATELLGSIGPSVENAVPSLIGRFKSADADLQRAIMNGLGSIHSRPALVVPLLVKQIEDSRTSKINRISALIALADFQLEAKPALPAIRRLLTDADPAIRNYATNAVRQIEPDSSASVSN